MPPKKRARVGGATGAARRSTRTSNVPRQAVPSVYREMLAEVAAAPETEPHARPPRKRRRVDETESEPEPANEVTATLAHLEAVDEDNDETTHPQVVYDDFRSSDDDDDAEFEDVDLGLSDSDDKPEHKVIQISIERPSATPSRPARRPVMTAAERKTRLEWHKAHLFLLLLSVWRRNQWCENADVHKTLKGFVPKKLIKLLHEDESKSALQRTHSFNQGIADLCLLWRTSWTMTGVGMQRARWRDGIDLDKEDELHEDVDLDDFKKAAQNRSGSRDLGAQIFCALLRAIAVECRLVCSLQVLPFVAAKGSTPAKDKRDLSYAGTQDFGSSVSKRPKKKQSESPYPVYWVEVMPPTSQTWIPLDPLVRFTISKPKTGYEPPASDPLNAMSYVIAFEDDGSARDVTRRYSQWFNAKTRKTRVENTKGGEEWMKMTLGKFAKPFSELRDDVEDADLLRRSEIEGMPKNIQDFKDHPIYVLERHLRKNEVIQPLREVGKTAVGTQKDSKLESVYRRRDVYVCRTSDAWYRRGRDIKQGEVPLKRVVRKTRRTPELDEEGHPVDDEAVLYAEYQTEVYRPPPVVNGKVPRNSFGNLDIYVSSMIPPGAVHVQHPLAAKAAKLLGVSYVDAVTGFDFKGRQGTAIINGIVVAKDVRYGLDAVIIAMQNEAIEEAENERRVLLLGLWSRWLTALRIRERVKRDYGGSEDDDENEDETYRGSNEEVAGGFMPNEEAPVTNTHPQQSSGGGRDALSKLLLKGLPPIPASQTIVVVASPHAAPEEQVVRKVKADQISGGDFPMTENPSGFQETESGGGFLADDEAGGFLADDDAGGFLADEDGGDFLPEEGAGGFLIDEDDNQDDHSPSHSKSIENESARPTGALPLELPVNKANGAALQHESIAALPSQKKLADEPRHDESARSTIDGADTFEDDKDEGSNDANDQDSNESLLSHDPDEDDAEPEWLMDSLG